MEAIEKKRLKLFLMLAFGISWASAAVIALTGGLVNSPVLVPGTQITLAVVLEASIFMWGPALANIITRLVTREGQQNLFLAFRLKSAWPYWLIAWFCPGLLTIAGAALFFVLFPQYYDASMSLLQAQLKAAGSAAVIDPFQLAITQTVMGILIAPLVNFPATFGEEFGWRGYLLPKLSMLGKRKALLLSGLIWGVWHWPVILMGHNYGLDYWGYPWTGLLATVWFTLSIGVFIGWLSQNARSVWPAVIAHAALNGIAAVGLFFVRETYPTLLGPTPAGVIGVLPFTVISVVILLKTQD